ncbi:MAG: flavodoxin family protein [Oscillospiraceae bacterium]|nr:flavodoxin family protein [Oscillospiraceae bacterium]
MRVLVLNGSPKSERSNTLNITKAFLKGFPEDTEVEYVNIYKLNIKPCVGCFSCWSKTPGKCVIKDDMQELYGKIEAADIVIESFPLYFFGMPSQLKCMTDRCLPFMLPYMGNLVEDKNASFHELRDESMHEKRLVVITTCGYVDANPMYPALLKQLDLICGDGHYTSILCPEGELFIAEKAKRQREGYLAEITKAGAEFAQNRCLCDETRKRIAKPILSPQGFEAITLAHWQQNS